ncbi:isoamyl acetate-hydrolyzing esterase 1 homolog isoform X2 [Tupaia chinensis]|uniref:isoamyl acetate-hydrolyzing esterase 1 homolog isoform X2 n=1 Tax=Tupaia chinensis TaxID=246437 RepID=UPI000FFCAED1|nr:isoamyl acetate-hydrolyzing esterase 1 homolog isoform X2 [Tupaia chinensis]
MGPGEKSARAGVRAPGTRAARSRGRERRGAEGRGAGPAGRTAQAPTAAAMALSEAASCGALRWPRVLLFGDSITQFSFQPGGWGAALADRLVRKCDVLNRGFSGYNTRWARIILPRLIRKGNSLDSPVAVTIFFGANDSALKGENPKQHVPLEEYVANLKSMVQYLKSVDVPENRVILITPPPLCEPAWEHECIAQGCKLNRLNSVVGEYAHACLQVAKDCGTDVLDLWTLMQQDNQLWPLVEKKVASLPLLLPYWRDVEEARPELSLLGDGDH